MMETKDIFAEEERRIEEQAKKAEKSDKKIREIEKKYNVVIKVTD